MMGKCCYFCKESNPDKIAAPGIGISFSTAGFDYCFCTKCLKKFTAYELFERLAEEEGFYFPLKYLKEEEDFCFPLKYSDGKP